jgi:membrane protease YdiL (CAAX protease family)
MIEGGGAPSRPHPLIHPLLRSLLFLLAFLAMQSEAGKALRLGLQLGGGAPLLKEGFGQSNEAFVLSFAVALLPLFVVSLVFLGLLDRRSLASIGLRPPLGGGRAALAQALCAPLGAAAVAGLWLGLLLLFPNRLANLEVRGIASSFVSGPRWWPASPALLLALLVLGFCIQGGVEEWVLRGYVYRALRERWRPVAAALASALLFSGLHSFNPAVSPVALLNIALSGVLLAGLVERSGSLWSATLAHGAWNFAVACLLSVPISGYSVFHLLEVSVAGERALTGGAFGPEGSLLLTPVVGLGAVLVWRLGRTGAWRGQPTAPEAGITSPVARCSADSGSP